ncbi:MAG: hypothetical protein MI865_11150 [Proteobacteria bacterium]|nr:hypothetical protein [Pseudomonadota bacterium]
MYIQHRRLDQPKNGRRLLTVRRTHQEDHIPERRGGLDRRMIPDRRKENLLN